jgi:hypothetical protein
MCDQETAAPEPKNVEIFIGHGGKRSRAGKNESLQPKTKNNAVRPG